MAFKRKEYHKEENCLNCGYPLIGKFCAQCGQKAFLHKDSFLHMAAHFVGDYFHYDNKFWLTIKTLFMKPGLATIEFIQGKRVKYLNPLQLYIFITTVFFLVAMSNDSDEKKNIKQQPLTKQQQDSVIAYKKTLVGINTADGENRIGIGNLTPNEPTREAYDSVQQSLPPAKRDGFFVTRIRRKSFSHSNDIGEQLQHHFSKVFFLLLPLFAMFLAFLFRKQKLFYVDHLIFSVHFHCMLFLMILVNILLINIWSNDTFDTITTIGLFTGLPIYLFISLKKVYPSPAWKIFIKLFLLLLLYLFAFIIAFLVLLFIIFIFF
jgi:hypothetical protein